MPPAIAPPADLDALRGRLAAAINRCHEIGRRVVAEGRPLTADEGRDLTELRALRAELNQALADVRRAAGLCGARSKRPRPAPGT